MEIFDLKTMQKCDIKEKTVIALGSFDGCHLGHASVLQNAFYKAKEMKIKSVVYTFDNVFFKGEGCILTLEEKIKAIRKFGIDYIAIESFDKIKDMDGEGFVNNVLLSQLKGVYATCGYNYRFGKNAHCDALDLANLFEKNGGSVQISGEITYNGQTISSTFIRQKIRNGEVEDILGYMQPYSIYAVVEKGKGLGKEFGFATINQQIPKEKVLPKTGVYITECEIGEDVYPSITNVGYRPTTDGENDFLNMETHILMYDGILYSSCIRVNFYKYIRGEIKFSSLDELKEQIERDKTQALEYFK